MEKAMATEIERKFLVTGTQWRAQVTATRTICQAYLARAEHASVRVRVIDGRDARLTIKSARTQISREEFEYPVPLADARAMLSLREGGLVEKVRHLVPAGGGRTWEIDVFAGAHEGLVLAEIELEHAEERFERPAWLGREGTGERCYGNAALALAGKVDAA